MSGRLIGVSIFALVATAGSLLSAGPGTAGGSQPQRPEAVRLAQMDNTGQGGGMTMDDKMRMQPQGQPGQTGGMSGQQSGQASGSGASTGQGGLQGQMGGAGGMQPQGSMGQGGPMMMMMENMMRMMNDNMRMPGMTTGTGTVDLTDRIEGRIAFLRAELRITDPQAETWSSFAAAVRSSRLHLIAARQLLNQPDASSANRLDRYERHLTERLEALKSARAAFAKLDAMLDDGQKRSANELVVPFIATF